MSLIAQHGVARTYLQGESPQDSLSQHVVAETCLHCPMSLSQHVVAETCLRVSLHWPMSLSQHVAAGTCLQDEFRCLVL